MIEGNAWCKKHKTFFPNTECPDCEIDRLRAENEALKEEINRVLRGGSK